MGKERAVGEIVAGDGDQKEERSGVSLNSSLSPTGGEGRVRGRFGDGG